MVFKTAIGMMFVMVPAFCGGCATTEVREREAVAVKAEVENRLPPVALAVLRAEFPAASVEEAERTKEKGIALFEVELEQGDRDIKVKVTSEGAIVEVEREVDAEELPQAVKEQLAKSAPGKKIKEAARIETRAEPQVIKLSRPAVVYDMDIENDRNEGEIAVAATCVVLRLKWEGREDEGDDEEEDRDGDGKSKAKRLAIDPGELEKVTQAVHARMPEAVIGAVELENEDGLVFYSVELTEADKKKEAEVSRDGIIMQIESEMAVADVPRPVKDVVEKAAPGARITAAKKEEHRAELSLYALDEPRIVYEVKLAGEGTKRRIEGIELLD
jgi:uncharacterized membrane protein YkoI